MSDGRYAVVFIFCESSSFEDFVSVSEQNGWKLIHQEEGDGQVTGFTQIRVASDNTTEIHYINERLLGIRFMVIVGDDIGYERVINQIGIDLDLRTSINILRCAKEAISDEEKMQSAYELAVIFEEPNNDALAMLSNYYDTGTEALRRRVISSLTYRGWPDGVKMLESISKHDSSEELREYAEKTAHMWRERGV
ncbi:hypothetical protein [Agarilytica rhodophyticola]|uniref:hypothetical protein n=1 Tax=Agarilytica rhodophyticola TaxID=1737490 RepID=UPI000B349182|nr:hypothetical protein [Agarilytica rhodophyticola]